MKTKTESSLPFLSGALYPVLMLFGVLVLSLKTTAQNLIPNPSFELRDSCPTGWHEGFPFVSSGPLFAQNWYMPSVGTADYFHSCAPLVPPPGNLPISVPVNMQGYQQPRTGQGYAGGIIELAANEYVEAPLVSPTVADHRYFISYWVNMADNSAGACGLFGAYASSDSIEMQSEPFLDMFTPQVESPAGILFSDSTNWTKVAGTYVSAGNERWLTIGNFHSPADQDTIQFNENMGFGHGPMYYHYDDVCMLDIDGAPSDFTVTDTSLCAVPTLTLSGRTTMQDFFWSDGSTGSSLNVTAPGTYWVKSIDVNNCIFYTDTVHVTGNGASLPLELGNDIAICYNQTVTLRATPGSFDRFQWNTGSTAASIDVTTPGIYSVTAFSECATGSDTISVGLSSDCNCLFVPNAFSPNSDGLNDKLKVSNSCPLGFFLLNIYNRFGEKIFTTHNPSDGWDGLYQGMRCDPGTYFYNIRYDSREPTSVAIRELKGDVTLLR